MPVWELAQAPHSWVEKMAYWLPYHIDGYFSYLQAATHGMYTAQFTPPEKESVKDVATRELNTFSRNANDAVKAFQLFKATRPRRKA